MSAQIPLHRFRHRVIFKTLIMNPLNPLIVQSNSTLLLEVNNPLFRETRDAITVFAHLEKSPEHNS